MKSTMEKAVTYHLEPGYVYVSAKGAVIRTVVGSCVAVSLWDRCKGAGGMNHFIHPQTSKNDSRTTTFGDVALPVLVKMMRKEFGSRKADLHAQIFGGGSPMQINGKTVGKENVEVAKQFLSHIGIKVVSEDVGGNMGRKILFDTATGQVAVLKVQQLRKDDWIKAIPDRKEKE